jgi:hypothetical protein
MVSSVLNMEVDELLAQLQRLANDCADDPDYRRLRADLPAEWPI